MSTYFKVLYDTQAGGEYTSDHSTPGYTELTWPGGGRGQIIQDFPDAGATGKLHVSLIAGALPTDGQTMTQGAVTADANGAATTLLYPAYFRLDVDITDVGADKEIDIDTVGGAPVADGGGVLPTHSLFFDGQTVDLTLGQTLTFSGGQTAQLVNIIDQTAADGEIEVRFISNLDAGLPVDGDTFTDEGTGDGTVAGAIHPRTYTPLNLHRLLADLNDDQQFVGDDDLSSLDPTPSAKDTDQIVRLIGGAYITDALVLRMYGGSIAQNPAGAAAGGDTKYSGLDVQVTTPLASTRPVLIQYSNTTGLPALIPDKWSNAWNPDSIAGNVRIMVKVRENGVDIDGRRVRGALLELGENYFFGGTTLGDATTSLALFSSGDGNDDSSGASHTTVVLTDGYQTLDYSNGNGPTDFGMSVEFGTETSIQTYQRAKYLQRRGTADTIFGLNGQLVLGMNRNFAHDGETGPLTENQLLAWGTIVAYDTQSGTFTAGESLTFSGGAKGRLLLIDDDTPTGTMIVEVIGGTAIGDDETITGSDSGATAAVNDVGGVDTIESRSGTGWLMAYDDDGTVGNTYYQALSGLDPLNNQPVYQLIGETITSVTVNEPTTGVNTRTINNQWIGLYTGTNFQTNFGIGIDISDAILGDLNTNLLGAQQGVPNNQSGVITNLVVGDRLWVYSWDTVTTDANGDAVPEWDQLSNDALLNGAAVATIVVTEAIPSDTPSSGALRVTNDEGIRVLIPYSSWTGSTFTLTSSYDFSGTGLNDSVAATNDIAIAYLDQIATATSHSFTGIYNADRPLAGRVIRGDNTPIVPFPFTPTFTATGFSQATSRIDDS